MHDTNRPNRREFLSRSLGLGAAAVAGPAILTGCATVTSPDRATRISPNDKVQVGYIGAGRRAGQLMGLPPDAQVVAFADVNRDRLAALQQTHAGAAIYQDYRDMLASPEVDAVVVASPDHWHALHSIHAMEAGKDVYVEKPMTLTIREGRLMVDAARRLGRICQVGSQQRSNDRNRLACALVRAGRVGRVHTVHGAQYPSPWACELPAQPTPDAIDWDMWCGPTEPRPYHEELYLPRVRGHEAGWISYITYSGGEMTGWGAHGLDQIQWALGLEDAGPIEIIAHVDQEPPFDGVHQGPRCPVTYRFPGGAVLHLDGKGTGGGGLFEGEAGWIDIHRGSFETSDGVDTSWPEERLYDASARTTALPGAGDTEMHLGNWIWSIRSRKLPAADVAIGHKATVLCHLGNIARWTGRPLQWDPDAERFVNDAEANRYLDRQRRAPWTL